VARFLLLHVGEGGGDSVKHALEVDIDHLIPFVDPQPIQGRKRHHTGIVDEHVDPPVGRDGSVHQPA
jgi:hypothetical protein